MDWDRPFVDEWVVHQPYGCLRYAEVTGLQNQDTIGDDHQLTRMRVPLCEERPIFKLSAVSHQLNS